MKHSDSATGWTFECPTDSQGNPPQSGLILKPVRHDGHNFAKDIRTIGLWLEVQDVIPPSGLTANYKKVRILDSSNYFTVSAVRTLSPKPITMPNIPRGGTFAYLKETESALYFSQYFQDPNGNYVVYGVAATYDAPTLF